MQVLVADNNRLEGVSVELTRLINLENGSFARNPSLLDESHVAHGETKSALLTLAAICKDHGGALMLP